MEEGKGKGRWKRIALWEEKEREGEGKEGGRQIERKKESKK